MTDARFDVVIPVGPEDWDVAPVAAASIRRFVEGAGDIFIVADQDPRLPDVGFVPEDTLPFDLESVVETLGTKRRAGWYYQQLIKLHFGTARPNGSKRYLVVDADVVFLRPTSFALGTRTTFNVGVEYHREYFRHMRRLHPSLYRMTNLSGVTHCMLFDRGLLSELFELVESFHEALPFSSKLENFLTRNFSPAPRRLDRVEQRPAPPRLSRGKGSRLPFWKIFLEQVNRRNPSGASEYELYFHYCLGFHRDEIAIIPKRWRNVPDLNQAVDQDLDYVALHRNHRTDVDTDSALKILDTL